LVRVRTEQRREVLAGQSQNRGRSSGRVWQRDSLVCSSIGAKSKEKKHLGSEIDQIKSNGDLGKKGDGKIWSKVESWNPKKRKIEKVSNIRLEEVKLPFGWFLVWFLFRCVQLKSWFCQDQSGKKRKEEEEVRLGLE
jgi:hypothetical protein